MKTTTTLIRGIALIFSVHSFAQNNPDCQQISLNNQIAVSNDSTTITAVETSGNYQWVRADQNNAAIGGATLSSFSPQQTGVYAVRITSAECPTVSVVSQSVSMNKDDMEIAGNLNVAGDAKFVQDVGVGKKLILDEITTIDSIGEGSGLHFLVRDGNTNGEVKGAIGIAFSDIIYQPRDCFSGSTPTWANGSDKLYALCGNVGIGTNAPQHKLHVQGDGLFHTSLQVNSRMAVGTDISTFARLKVSNPTNGAAVHIDQSDNSTPYAKLLFMEYTDPNTEILKVQHSQTGHTPLYVDASGNFRVSGENRTLCYMNADEETFYTRRVVINMDTWPDYVFEKDYQLPTLAEVRTHITEKGHLPGIPSRKEVLEQGSDLGEMNRILLEKVEELTLYLLEQEEKMQQLEQRLTGLETGN